MGWRAVGQTRPTPDAVCRRQARGRVGANMRLPLPTVGASMSSVVLARTALLAAAALTALGACAGIVETDRGPVASPPETVGPNPKLPPVDKHLLPTMQVAPAKGWAAGEKPVAAPGIAVNAFATGLDHPRWLLVLPNGDVLVAETNAPPKPEDSKGIKGKVQKAVQAKAGAGVETANRIT